MNEPRCRFGAVYCNQDGEYCKNPLTCDEYAPVPVPDTITSRDFFAGCALIGECIRTAKDKEIPILETTHGELANLAFDLADAMMEERSNG